MSYTDEQLKYINYKKNTHTKLLACAGSGKTRCIIARINKLIISKICNPESIIVLTFSRFTRDDFINKLTNYKNILPSIVNTIDKFAKHIIDDNGSTDVSLLSYKLMKYLENTETNVLNTNANLNKIKSIYIDESQDLNDIQYRIICALKDKMKIIINLVGDPNQNIYQFRESSDKYLINFDAVEFNLTKNFRSYYSIVEFSKHLRPFKNNDVICMKPDNTCKPSILFYENENMLEIEIIDILTAAIKNNIDISKFAILAPTRGRMSGGGKSHGLCFISNILHKAKIKFKQFYEESRDEIGGEHCKYEPTKNHVNILTYMGSKGLEWDYVIIVDADVCLINKNIFTEEKHKYDQYLLYVACSRAIQNMFIYSKCVHRNGQYHFNINPWFKMIPTHIYHIDSKFENFFYPKLVFRNTVNTNNKIWKIVDKLNYLELDKISGILQNKKTEQRQQIFNNKYDVEETTFLSQYIICLFKTLSNINNIQPIIEIENIVNKNTIITDMSERVIAWHAKNKNITWGEFDKLNIDPYVKEAINYKFDRNKPFNTHIISLNGYYQTYVLGEQKWIEEIYNKYLNGELIRETIFYIIVIKYSINTQHYFHIKAKGNKYKYILTKYKDLFDEIETYVNNNNKNIVTHNIEKWGIESQYDISDGKLLNINCSNISLKQIIVSVVTQLMYDNTINDIKHLNLLKGEELIYNYNLTSEEIQTIIDICVHNINQHKHKINHIIPHQHN